MAIFFSQGYALEERPARSVDYVCAVNVTDTEIDAIKVNESEVCAVYIPDVEIAAFWPRKIGDC